MNAAILSVIGTRPMDTEADDFVGPIITRGEISEAAVEAAAHDNPGVGIRVTDSGAYVRLEARGEITLTAAAMSEPSGVRSGWASSR